MPGRGTLNHSSAVTISAAMARRRRRLGVRYLGRYITEDLPVTKPRRKPPKGGSEPVTVEPDRPKLNEGGAAAELEFDD